MKAFARAALRYREGSGTLEELADAIALEGGYRSTAAFLCEVVEPSLCFGRREPHEAFIPLNGVMSSIAATRLGQMIAEERDAPLCVRPAIHNIHAILRRVEVDSGLIYNILDVFDWILVDQHPASEQGDFALRLVRGYLL